MSTSYQDALRDAVINLLTTYAGTTAYISVYTGTAPAKVSNAFVPFTGTLLAAFPLPNPIGATAVHGVLTLGAISNVNGAASGTPGYYTLNTSATDTDTTRLVQGSAGVGSGDLNFSATIVSGSPVSITSFTFTEGDP